MLWGANLRLARKLATTFVLGAGVFVLICSLLKTIFVLTVSVQKMINSFKFYTAEPT